MKGNIFNTKGKLIKFLKACCVGVLNTLIDLCVFSFLIYSGISKIIAQPIGFTAAMCNSYFCYKYFVFKSTRSITIQETTKFVICTLFVLLTTMALLVLVDDIWMIPNYIVNNTKVLSPNDAIIICKFLLVAPVGFVLNFILNRSIVFNEKIKW